MDVRGRVLLTLLSLFGQEPPRESINCPLCGCGDKAPTGECAACGVYQCPSCERYHLGEATQPCPGKQYGVEIRGDLGVK